MKRYRFLLSLVLAMTVGLYVFTGTGFCQCPGGNCPLPQYRNYATPQQTWDYEKWRAAIPEKQSPTPTPAWRYEECKGKYRSVVRVVGQDRNNTNERSCGSGCVVRYGKRIVVFTAAHVLRGTKSVFISTKRSFRKCRVLAIDNDWDVAILEPDDVSGLQPTEMAYGQAGMPKIGDRVDTCGYGSGDRLAVNSGFVKAFRFRKPGSAIDWMEISGPVRSGDSGGPVLNEKGELVGVLWGGEGMQHSNVGNGVCATQLGRLHKIISRISGSHYAEKSHRIIEHPVVPVVQASHAQQTGFLQQNRQGGILQQFCPQRQPTPAPQPNVVVQADPRVGNSLQSIDAKLNQVVANTTPQLEPIPEEEPKEPLPIFAVLAAVAGIVIGFVMYFTAQKGN